MMIKKLIACLILLFLIVLPLTGQEPMNDFWYSPCAGYSQLEFANGATVCVDSFNETHATIWVENLRTGEKKIFSKSVLEDVPSGTPRLHPDQWFGQHDEEAGVSIWVPTGTQNFIVYEIFIEDENS